MKVKIITKRDTSKLEKILKDNKIKIVNSGHDLVIAYGGDGTALLGLRQEKPVLALRDRNSVGYISDISLEDFKKAVKNLSKFKTKKLINLDVGKDRAVNDVLLTGTPRSTRFNVYLNGQMLLKRVVGDGLIIATPLGSTAYNLSAGGPIIMNESIALTLSNPHSHRHFKYVFSNKDKIEIEAILDANLVCDGREQDMISLKKGDKIEVKLSKKVSQLVKIPGFIETIHEKNNRIIRRVC